MESHTQLAGLSDLEQKPFQATIDISNELPSNGASLSLDILDKLNIPQHCQFEIKQNGDELQIGPFIGLLAGYYLQLNQEKS